MAKFSVGSFCSIAGGVRVALGNHRTDTTTTYPFKSLSAYWTNVPESAADHSTKGDVIIGSDVWIGDGVFIGSGVTIGSGAVIGAHSVVVKHVPAYAIAAGSPARVKRFRFDAATRAELLRLAWWDLDIDVVDSLLPVLMSRNVEVFLDALRRVRLERVAD